MRILDNRKAMEDDTSQYQKELSKKAIDIQVKIDLVLSTEGKITILTSGGLIEGTVYAIRHRAEYREYLHLQDVTITPASGQSVSTEDLDVFISDIIAFRVYDSSPSA